MSDEVNSGETAPNYVRRRLAVAGGAGLVIVALIAVVIGGGDDETLSMTVPSTTTTTTTSTTTTLPPTTTTTSTTTLPPTTSTTTSTTTTTVPLLPPPTTILVNGVPVWEPFEPLPALVGLAALTGEPAGPEVANRPVIAAKIDNFPRARPQWGLDQADVIIEENVEGVTRFVALFHSQLPDRLGPVRSARTGDLDILATMNRPILAWSGGNSGVTRWIESADSAGVLVDFTAQTNPCYNRNSSRRAPHNLQLNPVCAIENAPTAGPARQLWQIDAAWTDPGGIGSFPVESWNVPMDGVSVDWVWDAESEKYLRSQNGNPHLAASGNQIAVDNVLELYVFHAPSAVDARSPNPVTVGKGVAAVNRNGIRIPATWERRSAFEPFSLIDENGEAISLDAGTTFVELARDRER